MLYYVIDFAACALARRSTNEDRNIHLKWREVITIRRRLLLMFCLMLNLDLSDSVCMMMCVSKYANIDIYIYISRGQIAVKLFI